MTQGVKKTTWLSERCYPTPGAWLTMPAAFQFLLKSRCDLADIDPYTKDGQLYLYLWWERQGRLDYSDLDWRLTEQDLSVINKIDEQELFDKFPRAALLWLRGDWCSDLNLTKSDDYTTLLISDFLKPVIFLPRFLVFIFEQRADLQAYCNINSYSGQLTLLRWWMSSGRGEYKRVRWKSEESLLYISKKSKNEITSSFFALPIFAKGIWMERADLQKIFDLQTVSGCLGYLSWWLEYGRQDYSEIDCSVPLSIELLNEPSGREGIPAFLMQIAKERVDLLTAFDLNSSVGCAALKQWWENYGRKEYKILGQVDLNDIDYRIKLNDSMAFKRREKTQSNLAGVNVVGYPRGVLGIGEDARMMGRCMSEANLSMTLVEPPHPGPSSQFALPASQFSSYPKFSTTIFCLPPFEMMRLALEGGGRYLNDSNYKIGAWPWELPFWPIGLDRVFQFVDEVWAQSRFVEVAFRHCMDVTVHHMPMAVHIPPPTANIRAALALPSNDFLFYAMFDGNSWLSRKNPLAAVRAFSRGFSFNERGVGLVVKAMNVNKNDVSWQEIEKMAAADKRIHLINTVMSRQETINLMHSCDAYISLHRSEGFGRVIAESMLLGKPVIVTNFSGNVDYCDPSTAYMVDGELIPLKPGDYQMAEGQYWCEADVDIAARHMQDIVQDDSKRFRIARTGQNIIASRYSIESVSQRYKAHIETILGRYTR